MRTDYTPRAYVYKADIYHPLCVAYAGNLVAYSAMPIHPRSVDEVERGLSTLAKGLGIDREDEYSYDTDEFPKAVSPFIDFEQSTFGSCGYCGEGL